MSPEQRTSSEIAAEFDRVADEIRARHPENAAVQRMSPHTAERLRDQFAGLREQANRAEAVSELGYLLETVGYLEIARASAWLAQRQAVELARQQGRTWAEIGEQIGISRQAAQQRFATDSRQP